MPAPMLPLRPPIAVPTHYCPWDAPGRRLVQALCGVFIRRTDHSNAPTCPTCAQRLNERERAEP
jgi:hypothetical protein